MKVSMRKPNLVLCQELLNQTNSIDEAARMMSECKSLSDGLRYWRKKIIKCVEQGDLKI